jgi:hypothetical protein
MARKAQQWTIDGLRASKSDVNKTLARIFKEHPEVHISFKEEDRDIVIVFKKN